MSDLYTIEQAAQRLELRLLSGTPAEVKVLYGLAFLRLLRTATNPSATKAYLLQFARRLADAARVAKPAEFLPDELRDTGELASWMAERGAPLEYVQALADLSTRVRGHFDSVLSGASSSRPHEQAEVFGLTVEYYTDAVLDVRRWSGVQHKRLQGCGNRRRRLLENQTVSDNRRTHWGLRSHAVFYPVPICSRHDRHDHGLRA